MPAPNEKQGPGRRGRRQETKPGGWPWMGGLLLLTVVLVITFGWPNLTAISYSDFQKLVEKNFVTKVTFSEGSPTTLVAELKDVENLPEDLKKQVRNSNRVEVTLWSGDVQSGEVS